MQLPLRAATGTTPANTRGLPSLSPALVGASLTGGGGGSGSRAPQSAATAAAAVGARASAHFSASSSQLAAAAMPPLELLRSPAVRRMLQASREALPRGRALLVYAGGDAGSGDDGVAASASGAVAAVAVAAGARTDGRAWGEDMMGMEAGAGRAVAAAAGGGGGMMGDVDRAAAAEQQQRSRPSFLLTPPLLPQPLSQQQQHSQPPPPQQQLSPSDFGAGASSIPGNGGSPAAAATARRAPSPPPAVRAPPPFAAGAALLAGAASPGEHEWPALLPGAFLPMDGQAHHSTRHALGTGGATSETPSAPYPLPPHATNHTAVTARSAANSLPLSTALDAAMSAAAADGCTAVADFHDPRAFATLSGSKRSRDETAAEAASAEEEGGDGAGAELAAAAADSEAVVFDATGALDYESS